MDFEEIGAAGGRFTIKTTSHAAITTTVVRIAVATLLSTCWTPSFARIAVSAAKNAERIAHGSHSMLITPWCFFHGPRGFSAKSSERASVDGTLRDWPAWTLAWTRKGPSLSFAT